VTDFFDGWLARRYDAVSVAGAIMDPIADKILVCGALIGLVVLGARQVALPAGLILFREFAVSAMREVLAPRGIKLPVTFLAKTKTTLQLVAIAAILALPLLAAHLPIADELRKMEVLRDYLMGTTWLLWLAAAVTVWTGLEYANAARRGLKGEV
jgi:cardiolipin synthase